MTTPTTTDLVKLGYLFAEIMSSHDLSRLDEIKAPNYLAAAFSRQRRG